MVRTIIIAGVFFAARGCCCSAATYHVPGDYPRIQQALDVAASGDAVLVAAGTYVESLAWPDRGNVTLMGEGSGDQVYVSPPGGRRCLTATLTQMGSLTLRNLNFIGAHNDLDGGGVYLGNADVKMEACRIADNQTSERGAGGMLNQCRIAIDNCTIEYNHAGVIVHFYSDGGGLYIVQCQGCIRGSFIRNNSGGNGGGILCDGGVALVGNEFTGNAAVDTEGEGGGAYIVGTGVRLEGNYFAGNSGSGSALRIVTFDTTSIVNNLFMENFGGVGAGVIMILGSYAELSFNTFVDNGGYVVYCGIQSVVFIHSSIFVNNGHCIVNDQSTVVSNFNDFFGNEVNFEGLAAGRGDLFVDPLFIAPDANLYLLSQTAAGQSSDSACVDSGDPLAALPGGTTRTDGVPDQGRPDMGYHYSVPTFTPTPEPTATPPPTESPTVGPGLELEMQTNAGTYRAGDEFALHVGIANRGPERAVQLYLALDPGLGDGFYFWPSWRPYPPALDHADLTLWTNSSITGDILAFTWPPNAGSGLGWKFHAALLDDSGSDVLAFESCEFSFY